MRARLVRWFMHGIVEEIKGGSQELDLNHV